MNIIERSLARNANLDTVIPRERISLEPSVMYISEKHALSIINGFHEAGYKKVCLSNRSVVQIQARSNPSQLKLIQEFCADQGLHFINEGRDYLDEISNGKHSLINRLVIAGVDDTIDVLGAYGAIPLHISPTSMVHCLGKGKIETVIPETLYIEINGQLNKGISAEGMCEYLQDYFKGSLIGYGVVVGGSTVERLKHKERETITRFISKCGASLGVISPSGPHGQVESVVRIKAHHITTTLKL